MFVGQKLDSGLFQFVVYERIVDDLAGQKDATVGEFGDRFVSVLNGSLDAVAEPEFVGQAERQGADLEPETMGFHQIDDSAAVVFLELRTDLRT